jgi:Ca2+-binding RTX toxin-like protein
MRRTSSATAPAAAPFARCDGDDDLSGDDGNDSLAGGLGNDSLIGGEGQDTLNDGTGNDTLAGGSSGDFLQGGDDNDVLNGGDGKDFLYGGDGADKLTGGADIDTFVFNAFEFTTKDTVTDFKLGEDRLQFQDVFDGAGRDLQDMLDIGLNAVSSGNTLSIYSFDRLAVTISGWTGPQITSMQDLSQALGSNLEVIHS